MDLRRVGVFDVGIVLNDEVHDLVDEELFENRENKRKVDTDLLLKRPAEEAGEKIDDDKKSDAALRKEWAALGGYH